MNYILFGSGRIARTCLEWIIHSGRHDLLPVAIVADIECLSLKGLPEEISKLQIDFECRNEKELVDLIVKVTPQFLISVQYPWILSSTILNLVDGLAFNIHNAKLPEYRGHNALSYEILNGERFHISSLHLMVEEVDRGYLVLKKKIELSTEETAYSLWNKSIDSCLFLFKKFLELGLWSKPVSTFEQIKGKGKYYSKEGIQKKKIVPNASGIDTIKLYARAFHFPPHEPAYIIDGSTKIHLIPQKIN